MQISNKLKAYIGFSIKSRNILYGYESVIASKRKIYLIFVDQALGENSEKKIQAYAAKNIIPIYKTEEGLISYLCGGKNVKCIGLTKAELASAAVKELINIGGNN